MSSDRKGVLEVTGLPEPTGLDHRDHRDLRAEEQAEGGGGQAVTKCCNEDVNDEKAFFLVRRDECLFLS